MTTKHTPGPWRVVPSNGVAFDEWLVEVASDEFLTPGIAEVYEKADAALIAAAPDLLAALEAAHGYLVIFGTDQLEHVRSVCRAAIAKAKGEPT